MRIAPLLINLSLCATITSCGGDSNGDEANTSSNPNSVTSPSDYLAGEYPETEGLWVSRMRTQIQSPPNDPQFRIAEQNTTNTYVIDLKYMTYSDCDFNHLSPITDQDSLQSAADKLKTKLEHEFNEVFLSQTQVLGDNNYEFVFESASGKKVEWQNEKISDNTLFNSGSVSINWEDGLFYEVDETTDICSSHESSTNLQNEDKTESFVFGVPYGTTRLLVKVAAKNLDLMPGDYDLLETDDIEITIFMIDSITQPNQPPNKSIFLHMDRSTLDQGTLSLEQVTSNLFVGSINADLYQNSEIKINFDIRIP